MLNFKPETMKALDAGRHFELFFFDFMFFPIRVHAGDLPIEWEGLGGAVKENFAWVCPLFIRLFQVVTDPSVATYRHPCL